MEIEIIKTSKTKSEAIRKLFGYYNGKTQKKFETFIIDNNININHLKSKPSKYEKINKICPICNTSFETKIGNKEEKTTCSYSCSNKYFRSGKNHPNWGYGENGNEKNGYRRICFDNHKKECIICGENKIVSVHHYDENRNNNSPENLIPLCLTHHQYVHSRYKNEVIDKINEFRNNFIKKTLI
jgi:hypothetical protein